MVVANPTTPANLFHLLRRQLHRMFRKPLVIMSPKSLLKAPYCTSDLSEFTTGHRVMNIIPEVSTNLLPDDQVKRLIFCSGKVYYDIVKIREKNDVKDTAVVRVEQLAPFPFVHALAEMKKYPNAEITWVQEEPRNQGAWSFVRPRLHLTKQEATGSKLVDQPLYAGRAPSAAPATGNKKVCYAR
jgi:2-oxoglutarate dehydrogenase E1 component